MILSTRVDGVLFAPSGDQSYDHLKKCSRSIIFLLYCWIEKYRGSIATGYWETAGMALAAWSSI